MNIEKVPASHGLKWLMQGLVLLRRSFLIWVLFVLVLWGMVFVASRLPFAGLLLALFTPVFLGGPHDRLPEPGKRWRPRDRPLFRRFPPRHTKSRRAWRLLSDRQRRHRGIDVCDWRRCDSADRRRTGAEPRSGDPHAGNRARFGGFACRDGAVDAADHGNVVRAFAGGVLTRKTRNAHCATVSRLAGGTCCPFWSTG